MMMNDSPETTPHSLRQMHSFYLIKKQAQHLYFSERYDQELVSPTHHEVKNETTRRCCLFP